MAQTFRKKDSTGNTALHLAAAKGFFDCVQQLIQKDSNLVNQKNDAGDTPLIKAVASDTPNEQVVTTLINEHADVNVRGANDLTALHWAAYKNNPQTTQILIQAKADTSISAGEYGTPLQFLEQYVPTGNQL